MLSCALDGADVAGADVASPEDVDDAAGAADGEDGVEDGDVYDDDDPWRLGVAMALEWLWPPGM